MRTRSSLRNMILASIFCALVVVMTVVPYTGYISIGGVLEITTLHIVTILAGVLLGWKYGAIVGGVWGLTCILRCLMVFPIYKPFGFANVFVAFLPRLCVGLVSGALFAALKKTRMARTPAIMVTAVAGSLTNTVLVLSAMTIYCRIHGVAGYETAGIYTILQSIVASIAALNGIVEILAAVLIVPAVYFALQPRDAVLGVDLGASTTKLALMKGRKCLKTMLAEKDEPLEDAIRRMNVGKIDRVALTGVGASYIDGNVLNLPTVKVEEFDALSRGAKQNVRVHNCVLASVGTGTAFVRISPVHTAHLGGTGMGGGMLKGLCRALCGTENMQEFYDLANKGDLSRVDLVLKDVSQGNISNLKPETTVANLAKLAPDASREDIALGIYNLVFQSLGVMAAFATKGLLTRKVVMVGTIAQYPGAPAILDTVAQLHKVKFIIPENAGFITAIGAATEY